MAKTNEVSVRDNSEALRTLLAKREELYARIKALEGEIPEEFVTNELKITDKIDDFGAVNLMFKKELEHLEVELKFHEVPVKTIKQKIKNLETKLNRFKALTCDLVETFGTEGGQDGKKRLEGHLFWIKSQKKEDRKLKKDIDIKFVPDCYKEAVLAMPLEYLSKLRLRCPEVLDIATLEIRLLDPLPESYYDISDKKSVTFYDNTGVILKEDSNNA